MATKNTILSDKDSKLIEKVILKYGNIVTVGNLLKIFRREYLGHAAHNRIHQLEKNGLIKCFLVLSF